MFRKLRMFRLRRIEDYNSAWLGFTALIALALVLVVVLSVNSLRIGQRTVEADFAQAAQLEAGDQVIVAGVPVGQVVKLKLAGDHVMVTMSLNHPVHLGANTTAAIKLTTLLGNRYLELAPAGDGSLPDGRIPIGNTTVPYDLQSALADATTTFSDVDAKQVGAAFDRLSGQLEGLPQLIPPVMQNVRTLSDLVAGRREQIGSLLTSTSKLTTVIRSQQQDLGVLVTQGGELLSEIVSRRNSVETLLSATTSLMHTLAPIAVDDQPQIRSLMDNLDQIAGMLAHHDDLLRNILQVLPVPWRSWANMSGTGPEIDVTVSSGAFVDGFMCALAGRLPGVDLPPYSKECQ